MKNFLRLMISELKYRPKRTFFNIYIYISCLVFYLFKKQINKIYEVPKNTEFIVLINELVKKQQSEQNFDYIHFYIPFEKFIKRNNRNLLKWEFNNLGNACSIIYFLSLIILGEIKVIVLSSWSEKCCTFSNPNTFLLKLLKNRYKIKVVYLSWDSFCPAKKWRHLFKINAFSKILVLDNPKMIGIPQDLLEEHPNILDADFPMPMNLSLFEKSRNVTNKTNQIFFAGSVSSYRDFRMKYLNEIVNLENYGKNFKLSATHFPAYSDYLFELRRSQIAIDFTLTHTFDPQFKGRSWEIMLSGVEMIEQHPSQIDYFFAIENFHFFKSPKELVMQVRRNFNRSQPRNSKVLISRIRKEAFKVQRASRLYKLILQQI